MSDTSTTPTAESYLKESEYTPRKKRCKKVEYNPITTGKCYMKAAESTKLGLLYLGFFFILFTYIAFLFVLEWQLNYYSGNAPSCKEDCVEVTEKTKNTQESKPCYKDCPSKLERKETLVEKNSCKKDCTGTRPWYEVVFNSFPVKITVTIAPGGGLIFQGGRIRKRNKAKENYKSTGTMVQTAADISKDFASRIEFIIDATDRLNDTKIYDILERIICIKCERNPCMCEDNYRVPDDGDNPTGTDTPQTPPTPGDNPAGATPNPAAPAGAAPNPSGAAGAAPNPAGAAPNPAAPAGAAPNPAGAAGAGANQNNENNANPVVAVTNIVGGAPSTSGCHVDCCKKCNPCKKPTCKKSYCKKCQPCSKQNCCKKCNPCSKQSCSSSCCKKCSSDTQDADTITSIIKTVADAEQKSREERYKLIKSIVDADMNLAREVTKVMANNSLKSGKRGCGSDCGSDCC